jgi:hypothetical protein
MLAFHALLPTIGVPAKEALRLGPAARWKPCPRTRFRSSWHALLPYEVPSMTATLVEQFCSTQAPDPDRGACIAWPLPALVTHLKKMNVQAANQPCLAQRFTPLVQRVSIGGSSTVVNVHVHEHNSRCWPSSARNALHLVRSEIDTL